MAEPSDRSGPLASLAAVDGGTAAGSAKLLVDLRMISLRPCAGNRRIVKQERS
jgi:hypothetical protein